MNVSMHIFALGKVAAGTTLKVTDFTISDSSGEITTKAPETTKVSETTTKIAETTTLLTMYRIRHKRL